MKHIYLLTLMNIACSFSLFGQTENKPKTTDFRVGKFTYSKQFIFNDDTLEFPNTFNLDTVLVVRSKDRQTELYPDEINQYSVYEIKWLNDDKYELTLIESTKNVFEKGDKIYVEILARTANSYSYQSVSKLGTIKCTLIKISD